MLDWFFTFRCASKIGGKQNHALVVGGKRCDPLHASLYLIAGHVHMVPLPRGLALYGADNVRHHADGHNVRQVQRGGAEPERLPVRYTVDAISEGMLPPVAARTSEAR